jgi:hypothetical protein
MHPRYTVYRGGAPNASFSHHIVSAPRPRYSQYRIKIHLDCIVVVIHFILWKILLKLA